MTLNWDWSTATLVSEQFTDNWRAFVNKPEESRKETGDMPWGGDTNWDWQVAALSALVIWAAWCLEVEGAGFDAREVLPRVLRHLNTWLGLPAGDHVPPHVKLKIAEHSVKVCSLLKISGFFIWISFWRILPELGPVFRRNPNNIGSLIRIRTNVQSRIRIVTKPDPDSNIVKIQELLEDQK